MSEISIFQNFLDKITCLPINPKFINQKPSTAPLSSTINPPPAKPSQFAITLKPIRGESELVKVKTSMKVGELRVKAAGLFKIADCERCRLIRTGKALFDDTQSLEEVFGVVNGESFALHVLEKPAETTSTSSDSAALVINNLKKSDSPLWNKIDEILKTEGILEPSARSAIIEKFRKSL